MDYRNGSDQTYAATGEQLTDAEIAQLTAHLTEGLALLTGNTYSDVCFGRDRASRRAALA